MPAERVHMYGVVGVGKRKGKLFELTQMVEKPERGKAPSNLIITGRYILQPEIFDVLAAEKRGAGGEIQLTDAMIELAKTPAVLRPGIRRPQLRLRLEGRLPDRQRRLCARASRYRAGDAGGAQAAAGRGLALSRSLAYAPGPRYPRSLQWNPCERQRRCAPLPRNPGLPGFRA